MSCGSVTRRAASPNDLPRLTKSISGSRMSMPVNLFVPRNDTSRSLMMR